MSLLRKKPHDSYAYRMGNRFGESGQFLVRLLTLKDSETPWLFGKGLAGTRFFDDPITRSTVIGHRSGR